MGFPVPTIRERPRTFPGYLGASWAGVLDRQLGNANPRVRRHAAELAAGVFFPLRNITRAITLHVCPAGLAKRAALAAFMTDFIFVIRAGARAFFFVILLRRHRLS